MHRATAAPVTKLNITPILAIGNPHPDFWVLGWGYSFWLSTVSGIEIVDPSITFTLRPHHKCSSVTFSSKFCAEELKSLSNNFSGNLARAWQYALVSVEGISTFSSDK